MGGEPETRATHQDCAGGEPLHPEEEADGAGAEHDLARRGEGAPLPVLAHHQARHALAFEDQSLDHRIGLDRKIGSVANGTQEALRRVPAHAGLLVDVEVAAALVVAAVEVVGLGDAGLGGGAGAVVLEASEQPGILASDPKAPSQDRAGTFRIAAGGGSASAGRMRRPADVTWLPPASYRPRSTRRRREIVSTAWTCSASDASAAGSATAISSPAISMA